VEDLKKEFPDDAEVESFVGRFAPLLSQAMSLRSLPISDSQFYRRAKATKQAILEVVEHSARHAGIQRIPWPRPNGQASSASTTSKPDFKTPSIVSPKIPPSTPTTSSSSKTHHNPPITEALPRFKGFD